MQKEHERIRKKLFDYKKEKETIGKPVRESKMQSEEEKLDKASSLIKILETKEQQMIEKLRQT